MAPRLWLHDPSKLARVGQEEAQPVRLSSSPDLSDYCISGAETVVVSELESGGRNLTKVSPRDYDSSLDRLQGGC